MTMWDVFQKLLVCGINNITTNELSIALSCVKKQNLLLRIAWKCLQKCNTITQIMN